MPQRPNWVNCSAGSSAPPGAILGGTDVDGSHIYVGRAQHGNDQLVAKVIPSNKIAYVCYDGKGIYFYIF